MFHHTATVVARARPLLLALCCLAVTVLADPGAFAQQGKDSDFRAVARDGLGKLAGQIEALLKRSKDGNARPMEAMTRAHLEDCLREIKAILNPPKE